MAGKKDVDLERCMTASANQRTDSHASSTSKATRHYPIAVQNSSGKAILINVTVKEVNGHLVLNSAWDQISQALGENWYQRLARRLLMNIIVGTAKVRQLIHLETQTSPSSSHKSSSPPPRLFIQDFTPDPLLTEALHNPHVLFDPEWPPLNISQLSTPNTTLLLITPTLSKPKTATLLTSLLLLSPTLGLTTGLGAHDAEVGIAVSAGVFALATFIQGLVAWVQG